MSGQNDSGITLMFRLNIIKNPTALLIMALIVVGFFVYFFNLNNQLFWDDDDWIINNNFVHTISWGNIKFWLTHNTLAGVGLESNYYRPFLFFTFALNYVISGAEPFGYHLFSNLIHVVNGVLVFLLLKGFDLGISNPLEVQPQKFSRLNLGIFTAFLTAFIFTIHPLQTEAITYISGRGDALVVFFMLLALILLHRSETTPRLNLGVIQGLTLYRVLSLIFLVLALLSRETAIIFPFLALAFYVSVMLPRFDRVSKEWYSHPENLKADKGRTFLKSIKRGLIKTWPYFAIVIVYGILRLTVLNFQNTLNFYTAPNLYSGNLHYRLFTFMHVLVDYLKLLFVPTNLHMERSMVVHTSLWQWPVWLGVAIVALIIGAGFRFYKKERTDFHIWLFGWMWFFIGLGPVSGITPINAVIYEHWLYLPMIGFWLIISFYLVKLLNYQGSILNLQKGRILLIVALIAYFSFFAYQSIQRNLLWGDSLAFYMDILKYEPDSVKINNNVGNIYYNQKDIKNAEKYYQIAASQEDIFAEPHFNLGGILQSRGDIYGAIKEYEKAIDINPNFYYPYQNLAVIYAQQGNLTKAVENMEKLKLIIPNNPRVYYNSALVYIALNDKEQALKDLLVGLKYAKLDPQTSESIRKLIKELER